jgi:ribosomal protein S18 acetylase RimI-like enzyme
MTIDDYDAVMALLQTTIGVTLREADSRESTLRHLDRNAGHSFVAEVTGHIIGCVMGVHDGRRGYLQHLAVDKHYRRCGIGTVLVNQSVASLKKVGIHKVHIFVLSDNNEAKIFWAKRNWKMRTDIALFSFYEEDYENA